MQSSPNQPSSAQPGRAPVRPRRLTGRPRLSAETLSPARSLSFSPLAHWGRPVVAGFFTRALLLSLPRGPGLPVAELLSRAPLFSLTAPWTSLSDPHSPCPPWTDECAFAHDAGFLGHVARPRAQLPS
jgi:hypothetical protein